LHKQCSDYAQDGLKFRPSDTSSRLDTATDRFQSSCCDVGLDHGRRELASMPGRQGMLFFYSLVYHLGGKMDEDRLPQNNVIVLARIFKEQIQRECTAAYSWELTL